MVRVKKVTLDTTPHRCWPLMPFDAISAEGGDNKRMAILISINANFDTAKKSRRWEGEGGGGYASWLALQVNPFVTRGGCRGCVFVSLSASRVSSFLFVATVLLLCVYVKLLGSCDRCCR